MCHRCQALVPHPKDLAAEEEGNGPSLWNQFFNYLALHPRDYPGVTCVFSRGLILLGEEIFLQTTISIRYDPKLITKVMSMLWRFVEQYGSKWEHKRLQYYWSKVYPAKLHPIEGQHIYGVHYRYNNDWVLQWAPFTRGLGGTR